MSERIALGFCNNVDYEIVWNADILNELVIHYQIGADEPNTGGPIRNERDLVVSILGFMKAAEGGERFVGGSEIIERFSGRFEKRITLGGTSVRAAVAMRKLGYTSALHLITQNENVRRLIPADSPFVCSNDQDSFYPHLIVQFGEGDRVCAGDIDIGARQSNRVIYHCNADRIAMRLAPDFADLLGDAQVLLISGFNAMQDRRLLLERLATVSHLLARLSDDAIVYLEDGGYYDRSFRKAIHHGLGARMDVFGLNEDELQTHLQRKVPLRETRQVAGAVKEAHRYIPAAAVVFHTQHWALVHGNAASRYADALRAGVTLATTRFRFGDDFTLADFRDIESRAPSDQNAEFAKTINATAGDDFYCVPVADVEQANATTIGLGDAFVGGFLPALLH